MRSIGILFFVVLFLASHAHLSSKVGARGNIRFQPTHSPLVRQGQLHLHEAREEDHDDPEEKTLHPALVNAGIEGNNDEAHLEHDARAVANYGKLDEQHHVPSTKM